MKKQRLEQHYDLPVAQKHLYLFACKRKRPEKAFLTLTENYHKIIQIKQIMPFKTTVNWLFNDDVCYLVIGCFD